MPIRLSLAILIAAGVRPAIAMEKWLEKLSRNAVRVSAPTAGTYRGDIDVEKHR